MVKRRDFILSTGGAAALGVRATEYSARAGMSEKALQQILAPLHPAGSPAGSVGQGVKIEGRIVRHGIGFEIGPQVFDGVEFGSVRREIFQVSRTRQDALVDQFFLVGLEAIPDQHNGRAQLMLKVLEEIHGTFGVDVGVRMQPKVQRDPLPYGLDANSSDSRHFLLCAAGHEHPDSSRKTTVALRRAAFFYSRPILLDRGTDALLIALDSAPGRLLGRESQTMQQATDMRGVILHAESAFNQPCHPRKGPQVRGQAGDLSALKEHSPQTRQITARQAPWSTRGRFSGDGRPSTVASCCFPASNTAPINADLAGHLDQGEPFIEQAHRAQTSLLKVLRTSGRTYSTSPPGHSLGHHLRNDQ